MASITSQPGTLDLNVYRGDTLFFSALVKDSDGVAIDLSGYTVQAEIYTSAVSPLALNYSEVPSLKQATSEIATLTVGSHKFEVGNSITVAGVGAPFNGTWEVSAITSTTVSYILPIETADVTSAAATGTVTLNASFVVGTTRLDDGYIDLFLTDGVSALLPDSCLYDVEISKKQNLSLLGDSVLDATDDHWTVMTILKGTIIVTDDITNSTGQLPSDRGQLA